MFLIENVVTKEKILNYISIEIDLRLAFIKWKWMEIYLWRFCAFDLKESRFSMY